MGAEAACRPLRAGTGSGTCSSRGGPASSADAAGSQVTWSGRGRPRSDVLARGGPAAVDDPDPFWRDLQADD